MSSLERVLMRLVLALGVVAIASWVALAFVHLHTLYDVNQTSGAWLSYAWFAGHGVLYPPLYEDGWYAGTRYFPGFFVLHAAFAQLTGEYLASGKLLTFVSTLAVVAALATVLARKTRESALSVAFAGVLVATYIGHKGSLTIRGDVLPLALSLWAVVIFERDSTRERSSPIVFYGSALLAGLAPMCKFTSFHAMTAVFLALLQRDRKRAFLYGVSSFGVFVVGVLLTQALSDGRFFENLAGTAVAPPGHARTLVEAAEIYLLYERMDPSFLALLPFAGLSLLRARRPVDPWRIYFVLQAVISLGFFFDTGAEYNHLIDLLCATIILAADFARTHASTWLRSATLAAFAFAAALGLASNHRTAWTSPERGVDPRTLFVEKMGLGEGTLLAHDPTVSVLLGKRPVVADDFQYRVLVMRKQVPIDELPRRIAAHAFDHIVLLNPPEPDPEDPASNDRELGPYVAAAIREHYALADHVGKYWVYKPRR